MTSSLSRYADSVPFSLRKAKCVLKYVGQLCVTLFNTKVGFMECNRNSSFGSGRNSIIGIATRYGLNGVGF